MLTQQEPNGVISKNDLDAQGRLSQVSLKGTEDDSFKWTKKIFYYSIGNPNAQHIETRVRVDETDDEYHTTKKYFDGLGRTYKEVADGNFDPNSATIQNYLHTYYEFNETGKLKRKSNPVPVDANNNEQLARSYTSYSYDEANRVKNVTFPDGTSTSYLYNNSCSAGVECVTITDAEGKTKKKEYDGWGRLVRVTDANIATVNYSYDDYNYKTTITNPDNLDTIFTTDSLGRKASLKEPNSGTFTYKYDDANNLIEQIDPKNQTIRYEYDKLNRLTKKDLPDGETDVIYGYDDSSKSYSTGRVTSISDASGALDYTYDQYGNLKHWIKTVDGMSFSFSATYDIRNQMEDLTYPDGSQIRKYYSPAGYLRMVRLLRSERGLVSPSTEVGPQVNGSFGAQLVTYFGPNIVDGKYEFVRRTGNNVKTTVTLNAQNLRAMSIVSHTNNGLAGSTELENTSYEYDNAGNITGIIDNIIDDGLNATQNFTYDNLYRIKTAVSPGLYGTLNYDFTPGGKLKKKGDTTLEYNNPQHPQAVTSAIMASKTVTYGYDNNGNMTTREGRSLEYDSEDRLVKVKENDTDKQNYVYDYSGQRVKKVREDGTTVYYIGGLYEVVRKSSGPTMHTKYVLGLKGEKVAQLTKPDSNIALLQRRISNRNKEVYASIYGFGGAGFSGNIIRGFKAIYGKADYFLAYYHHVRIILLGFFTVIALIILFGYVYHTLIIKDNLFISRIPALSHIVPMVLILFIFVFGFNGCSSDSGGGDPVVLDPPIEITAPGIDELSGTYNDSTRNGFPVEGTYFYHPNHLGSTAYITDTTREGDAETGYHYNPKVIARYHYKPYGEIIRSLSKDQDGKSQPDIVRHKFTGQEEDAETGLMYYNARYYDPTIGLFTSLDTIIPDPEFSQNYNRYMYVRGNPVRYNDPSGHDMAESAATTGASGIGGEAGARGDSDSGDYSNVPCSEGPSDNMDAYQSLNFNLTCKANGRSKGGISKSTKKSGGNLKGTEDNGSVPAVKGNPSKSGPSKDSVAPKKSIGNDGSSTMPEKQAKGIIAKSKSNKTKKPAFDITKARAVKPIKNGKIVSGYDAPRYNKKTKKYFPHGGLDIHGPVNVKDVEVVAAYPGVVEKVGWQNDLNENEGFGYYVRIRHADNSLTYYGHLRANSSKFLKVGQSIKAGDVIGIMGNTGFSTGTHLHFDIRRNGLKIRPNAVTSLY